MSDAYNMSMRMFFKQVGVTSQQASQKGLGVDRVVTGMTEDRKR